jgi:hypothetical protein
MLLAKCKTKLTNLIKCEDNNGHLSTETDKVSQPMFTRCSFVVFVRKIKKA